MRLFVLTTFVLGLTGCATIFGGAGQYITVNSNVEGAEVSLYGRVLGQTPLHVRIPRRQRCMLTVSKAGYRKQNVFMKTGIAPTFWLNILLGGLPGTTTDLATKSIWEYSPNHYFAQLSPAEASKWESKERARVALVVQFVLSGYAPLTRDLTAGRGEYSDAILSLMGVPAEQRGDVLVQLRSFARRADGPVTLARLTVRAMWPGLGYM